jgi:hypothetical protein
VNKDKKIAILQTELANIKKYQIFVKKRACQSHTVKKNTKVQKRVFPTL